MRDLTLGEVVELHRRLLQATGAAMETFLILNGSEINALVDDQERLMLDLASGQIDRSHFVDWLRQHVTPLA